MSPESCENCRFSQLMSVERRYCRRHPPSVSKGFGFPTVDRGDWCGEHEFPLDVRIQMTLDRLEMENKARNELIDTIRVAMGLEGKE